MVVELRFRGIVPETERPVPVNYRGITVAHFRLDLVVDNAIVVEIKAVKALEPIHQAQVITYLKLTGCPVGLLINFNVPLLRNGIRRLSRPDLYRHDRNDALGEGPNRVPPGESAGQGEG
jgi:GxxExxY protein